MKDIVIYAPIYRAYADWKKVQASLTSPADFKPVAANLLASYDKLTATYREARGIVKAFPKTDGAQVLSEMLEIGGEKQVLAPGFLPALKKEVAALTRRYGRRISGVAGSALLTDKTPVAKRHTRPERAFQPLSGIGLRLRGHPAALRGQAEGWADIRPRVRRGGKASRAGKIGADGPFKVFVNGKEAGCNPKATNPINANIMKLAVNWKKGKNEVVIAIRTNNGGAWGFHARAQA